jgi:hypothetical protein
MPIKSGTLDHLQAAYTEAIAETVKGLVGSNYNNGTMYILNGMVNSGVFPTYNITAGSVFYNGEIYLVDAASFTLAGAQVAVCKIVTTQFSGVNADAVTFSDLTPRNVHDIRKVVISADLAGSGISNYADGQRISANIPQVNLISGIGINITGTYPDKTITNTVGNKILQTGYIFIGDLNSSASLDAYTVMLSGSTSGLSAYLYTFPTAMADANFVPMAVLGNNGHNDWGGFNDNFMCTLQIGQFSATQMYFAIGTTASGNTQSVAVKYALISTV